MARPGRDVTEAELAVLEGLWELGPVPSRALVERRYPGGGASATATVQKLLERLEAKGFVRRERGAAGVVFAAMIDREALIDRRLRDLADELCGGSMTPLLTRLVDSERLPAEERKALRSFLDEIDPKKPARED